MFTGLVAVIPSAFSSVTLLIDYCSLAAASLTSHLSSKEDV
jgi:hypothetical protein